LTHKCICICKNLFQPARVVMRRLLTLFGMTARDSRQPAKVFRQKQVCKGMTLQIWV